MSAHLAPRIALLALTGAFLAATPAAASTVFLDGSKVVVSADPGGTDLRLDAPSPSTVRVQEFSTDDDLVAFPGGGCTEPTPETVTCTVGTSVTAELFGGGGGDAIEVDPGVSFHTELYGGGGNDVLLGGGGNDRLGGGTGDDQVDGRGGSDLVDNGNDNGGAPTSDDGSDRYEDTGTTGVDSLNYGFQTVGVSMSVNGIADDGADGGAEGDDIAAGFEQLRGTVHNDVILGGPAAETINGSKGDDDLTGGAGADIVEGNEGVDRLRMRDGVVDVKIDCDSASASSFGAGEIATIDAGDPAPERCEVIERENGGGGTAGGGAGGGGTTGGSKSPTPPPAPPAGGGVTVTALGSYDTLSRSRMPRVTGQTFSRARAATLTALAFADVDLTFRKGCSQKSDLEVVRQVPLPGATVVNHVMNPVPVSLTVCVADRDFLRDCDLKDLRSDLRELPKGSQDAEVVLDLLASAKRCKVDYDIKLSKAAEEAKVKLAAQTALSEKAKADSAKKAAANKIKGDLRAAITCPLGGDLRVALTEGQLSAKSNLGLKTSGPDGWTIPYRANGSLRSAIDVIVFDAALQFPDVTVFVDTDQVLARGYGPGKVAMKKGRGTLTVAPTKPGKIRLCAVQETGGDQVLSWGAEIRVVAAPANGQTYETISGRQLKMTPDGAAPVAATSRAAFSYRKIGFFDGLWDAVVYLFGGRSKTVNAQASSPKPKREKAVATVTTAALAVGQVTMTGKLGESPGQVALKQSGLCFTTSESGKVVGFVCPTLEAPGGQALVGTRNDGTALVAAGGGNVTPAGPATLVAAGGGNLVGLDGSTLVAVKDAKVIGAAGQFDIGPAKSEIAAAGGVKLIGNDGSTLIGNDGSTLIGNDGSTLVDAGGLE